MRVTVAICSWNRASLLDQTLGRMRELRIPDGVEWELLVVNNNCTDTTDEVISQHANALPIRRLFEERQGKSHSANLAIREAYGDIILWTDDDVLVDPNWLLAYVRASQAWTDFDFFAGLVDPWFESNCPDWLLERWTDLKNVYAAVDLGDDVRPFPDGYFPAGANMAVRTNVQKNHMFNTKLGPSSLNNIRGDDNRLYLDLLASGIRSLWVGDARVQHFIPNARLSKRYVGEWFEGAARTVVIDDAEHLRDGVSLFGVPRWLLRQYLESLVKHTLLSTRGENASIDEFVRLKKLQGTIKEMYRQSCGRF